MCKWGDTVIVKVDGVPRNIDRCIAPIVRALNAAKLKTVASCCGHEKQPSNIALVDGREIMILSNYEDARTVNKLFSSINI